MPRQELADAVNAHAYAHADTGCRRAVGTRYVGRLGRGEHRWPFELRRTALREILGKTTNADLGFFIIQGHAQDPEVSPEEPGLSRSKSPAPGADPDRPVIMARAAVVRVAVNVYAETVTALVRHHDTTGAVAVFSGTVEVIITLSDVARDGLAAGPDVPPPVFGVCQVHRLSRRRAR